MPLIHNQHTVASVVLEGPPWAPSPAELTQRHPVKQAHTVYFVLKLNRVHFGAYRSGHPPFAQYSTV